MKIRGRKRKSQQENRKGKWNRKVIEKKTKKPIETIEKKIKKNQ